MAFAVGKRIQVCRCLRMYFIVLLTVLFHCQLAFFFFFFFFFFQDKSKYELYAGQWKNTADAVSQLTDFVTNSSSAVAMLIDPLQDKVTRGVWRVLWEPDGHLGAVAKVRRSLQNEERSFEGRGSRTCLPSKLKKKKKSCTLTARAALHQAVLKIDWSSIERWAWSRNPSRTHIGLFDTVILCHFAYFFSFHALAFFFCMGCDFPFFDILLFPNNSRVHSFFLPSSG